MAMRKTKCLGLVAVLTAMIAAGAAGAVAAVNLPRPSNPAPLDDSQLWFFAQAEPNNPEKAADSLALEISGEAAHDMYISLKVAETTTACGATNNTRAFGKRAGNFQCFRWADVNGKTADIYSCNLGIALRRGDVVSPGGC